MEASQENGLKKGPWSTEEDRMLIDYIEKHGQGNWQTIPKQAGLNRCGKSCRLRWTNYLKPGIKRGGFSEEEEATIIDLHEKLGNKWSRIAAHLPRRTDNEIKNYWNTHLRKKLIRMGIDPKTHRPIPPGHNLLDNSQAQLLSASNLYNFVNPFNATLNLSANANDFIEVQILQSMLQLVKPSPLPCIQGNANLGELIQFNRLCDGTNNNFTVDHLMSQSSIIPDLSNISTLLHQQPSPSNSFPGFEGETIPAAVISDNVKISTSNTYNSEYSLPPLVSLTPENSTVNQLETIQQSCIITEPPHHQSDVFSAWENLVDDEANGSFWKDILG